MFAVFSRVRGPSHSGHAFGAHLLEWGRRASRHLRALRRLDTPAPHTRAREPWTAQAPPSASGLMLGRAHWLPLAGQPRCPLGWAVDMATSAAEVVLGVLGHTCSGGQRTPSTGVG